MILLFLISMYTAGTWPTCDHAQGLLAAAMTGGADFDPHERQYLSLIPL